MLSQTLLEVTIHSDLESESPAWDGDQGWPCFINVRIHIT